ncbi:CenpB-DNA-bind-domain-containing protein [Lindgomyces ingoldianus]|uniref:CenpB-DNA-bind-domain-containing protein n=1 Tax=Lindgomyces ingoldianus TaxID=673940 RepID=A0ACB6Q8S7_9PLEO|nr:CenpB-DNA-bind-domain-containing protein [Lindgomyces ingoldianus]KAF2463290.1 CenpB-DNA-bind-domain-containing protein [Lindgomyces ingoldianus]
MSQLQMDHEQHHHHQDQAYDDSNSNWAETNTYSHPHHQSPVQDYNGFNNYAPLPMEPLYTTGMHPPRTTHPQLQPLIMPQWPSMLTSQSTYVPPIFPSAPVPITPASATPVSATSTRSHTSSTPRKTLTDSDRRRMCLYHEEHPTVKQTEIGAMFGVERSTVSKVLRQKEKYLYQDDGSRSPIKRSKGKFPDIERALSNWARNHQRQGLPLNDAMIREKAKFFATTVGNSESHLKANSASWLEKFKQKNNLMGAKSRKSSIAEESEGTSNPPSNAHTPGGISPTSPSGVASPSPITLKKSEENLSLKTESPDNYDFSNHHRPFHSQSNTSLSSVFTDTAPSSFSAGATSPTSPFFTPDSACGTSPFIGHQQARGQPGSSNFQRPRSQTFPMLVGVEQYMSPPPSSDALTPKYIHSTALESPMGDVRPSLAAVEEAMQASPTQVSATMQPPPVPASLSQSTSIGMDTTSPITPSQEEARRALELVMSFFQQQPSGFVEPQEYVMIGKLMEKLKLNRSSPSLPSGMRRVSEPDFGMVHKVENSLDTMNSSS